MTKEFIKKIARYGGVYDTAKYRYIISEDRTVRRTELKNLDTTAMLEADAWTVVGKY